MPLVWYSTNENETLERLEKRALAWPAHPHQARLEEFLCTWCAFQNKDDSSDLIFVPWMGCAQSTPT